MSSLSVTKTGGILTSSHSHPQLNNQQPSPGLCVTTHTQWLSNKLATRPGTLMLLPMTVPHSFPLFMLLKPSEQTLFSHCTW